MSGLEGCGPANWPDGAGWRERRRIAEGVVGIAQAREYWREKHLIGMHWVAVNTALLALLLIAHVWRSGLTMPYSIMWSILLGLAAPVISILLLFVPAIWGAKMIVNPIIDGTKHIKTQLRLVREYVQTFQGLHPDMAEGSWEAAGDEGLQYRCSVAGLEVTVDFQEQPPIFSVESSVLGDECRRAIDPGMLWDAVRLSVMKSADATPEVLADPENTIPSSTD